MDCHGHKLRGLGLALGLLSWAGCHHPATQPTGPTNSPNYQPPPPPSAVIQKEKPSPSRPPRPDTCVAAGDFCAREAATKEHGSADQEQLRERARKAYQQALTIDSKFVPAYHALAQLYTSLEDHEHAVSTYRKALQILPREAELHFQLGMCFGRCKDWPAAVKSFERAVELDPENRPYINTLGFALARTGRYQDSLNCFTRVHTPALAHYQLARMLLHVQQPDLCRRQLQLALQIDPSLDEAQKMLEQLEGGNGAVRTVGYQDAAPAPNPSAALPEGRPMVVEVKPELSRGRTIMPMPVAPAVGPRPVGVESNPGGLNGVSLPDVTSDHVRGAQTPTER